MTESYKRVRANTVNVLNVQFTAADNENTEAESRVGDLGVVESLVRIESVKIAIIKRDVACEVALHNTVIHKSVGYYFAGGLVFILLNSDKAEIYAFGSGYIVATHFVTSRAILVAGIRLMSLNGTVNHLHVVAHLKGKESRIRNTVGLIRAPHIDYTVTVSVGFDCHILTIDNVLNIIYKLMGAFFSATRIFDGLMYIVVVVAGGIFMLLPQDNPASMTPADYVAYLMFVTTLITSVRRIVEFSEQFQNGLSGIERFCEIMDTDPDIVNEPDAKDINNVVGDVEFDNVSFKYESNKKNVLTSLNLNVKAGESIALVGPSGGGKTTLCSLLPRFYEVSSGTIKIDGVDIKKFTLNSLRNSIGVVQQDVYLFSGSVRENIAYGKLGATDDEIVEAAKLAGAHDFIMTLPDGYDTYVGERGVKLSGGQKQRVSIARLFLKNPPILILDEATSALDNESERIVQQSLETLARGRTTFTIAHRLTTIKNADRILVLTENGIEESGTHNQLMEKGGIYSQLYTLYSRD